MCKAIDSDSAAKQAKFPKTTSLSSLKTEGETLERNNRKITEIQKNELLKLVTS